jgi:hypothetical protein
MHIALCFALRARYIIRRSYYEHVNVTWSNGQMSYKTWMYYVLESSRTQYLRIYLYFRLQVVISCIEFFSIRASFSARHTAVPVSTNITTVNIPYQLVLPGIMDYGNAAYFPYVLATKSPKSLFVNVTIDQALWGYESPIFAYIHGQNPYVSSYYTGLSAGNMSDRMTAVNSTVYDTVRAL